MCFCYPLLEERGQARNVPVTETSATLRQHLWLPTSSPEVPRYATCDTSSWRFKAHATRNAHFFRTTELARREYQWPGRKRSWRGG